MREMDEVLDDGEFARDVAVDVRPSDFAPVRAAALRRAGRRRTAAVGAAALGVVVVLGGVWLGVSAGDDAPGPAGRPSESPTVSAPTEGATQRPERPLDDGRPLARPPAWIDGDNAHLTEFAMVPGENVVAGIWRCSKECEGLRQVLVVKSGGERTMFAIRPRGGLMAAGAGRFVLAPYAPAAEPRLFGMEGEIPLQTAPEGPLEETEILVPINGSGVRAVGLQAVDAVNAIIHPIPAPEGDMLRAVRADRTSLTAEGELAVWTSEDGGASWARNDVDRAGYLSMMVPSARPGSRFLLLGGDGASLFPIVRVAELEPDGSSVTRDAMGETRYAGGAMVRLDGRLVVVTESTGRGDRPAVRWWDAETARLEPVRTLGFDDATFPMGVIDSPAGPVLLADTAALDEVLVSTDGEVWKSVGTR